MRPSLGWSEREIAGMVAGFARTAELHFLPDDQATVDRALVAGRTLAEVGDSAARPRAVGRGASAGGSVRRQAANSRYRPPMVNATIANSSGS